VEKSPLEFLVRKLRSRSPISDQAANAILQLPWTSKFYDPPGYMIREGAIEPRICSLIVSGYAFRQKLTTDGARQIVSLHMRGDMIDLQHMFLNRADHNVQALTRVEALNIEREALQKLILAEPTVGKAMWIDALVDASIYREWVVNVGRRDAKARIAHLLCEFATRLRAAGLSDGKSCHLPMTQEQLGDAVGLTPVHVNRTLKALAQDGIIQRSKREIAFTDWERIRALGDFNDLYLHLDQTTWSANP
jgi:CRP-like cAMP-binding protein